MTRPLYYVSKLTVELLEAKVRLIQQMASNDPNRSEIAIVASQMLEDLTRAKSFSESVEVHCSP